MLRKIGNFLSHKMKEAYASLINFHVTQTTVARMYGVSRRALARYLKKFQFENYEYFNLILKSH